MSEQLLQKNKALQELLQACAEAFEEIHGAHSTDRDTCIEMRGRIRDELAKQVEPSLDGWAPCSPELLNSGVSAPLRRAYRAPWAQAFLTITQPQPRRRMSGMPLCSKWLDFVAS